VPHCDSCPDQKTCATCSTGWQLANDGNTCLYACTSDLSLGVVASAQKKGLVLDDTTHHYCSDAMHSQWANTKDAVTSVRIGKAWESDWNEAWASKTKSWDNFATFAHSNNARALVGTQITCNETNDDLDWANVLRLLPKLGPNNVMGISIGHELELLWTKQTVPRACVLGMWGPGGYLLKKFHSRVADVDKLGPEWKNIKITSVFGDFINSGQPFVNTSDSGVLGFLKSVVATYDTRYVFSMNIYPYFDAGNNWDDGTHTTCNKAIAKSVCFDELTCFIPATVANERTRIQAVWPGRKIEFWITETGWSSPTAHTLKGVNKNMAACAAFSDISSFKSYYSNFLKWDMQVKGCDGPDHIFFFTMRDQEQDQEQEHFGLGSNAGGTAKWCTDTGCKIQSGGTAQVTVV